MLYYKSKQHKKVRPEKFTLATQHHCHCYSFCPCATGRSTRGRGQEFVRGFKLGGG